jgi:hypothetical protein
LRDAEEAEEAVAELPRQETIIMDDIIHGRATVVKQK